VWRRRSVKQSIGCVDTTLLTRVSVRILRPDRGKKTKNKRNKNTQGNRPILALAGVPFPTGLGSAGQYNSPSPAFAQRRAETRPRRRARVSSRKFKLRTAVGDPSSRGSSLFVFFFFSSRLRLGLQGRRWRRPSWGCRSRRTTSSESGTPRCVSSPSSSPCRLAKLNVFFSKC
jgi:hypothetical protein